MLPFFIIISPGSFKGSGLPENLYTKINVMPIAIDIIPNIIKNLPSSLSIIFH